MGMGMEKRFQNARLGEYRTINIVSPTLLTQPPHYHHHPKKSRSLTLTENDYSTDSFVESENDPYLSTFDRLHSKIQTNLPRSGSSDIKMTKE